MGMSSLSLSMSAPFLAIPFPFLFTCYTCTLFHKHTDIYTHVRFPNPVLQGLVKSTRRDDQQLGVVLLSEIFRTSPERRRECLYYLALGNFKLGNYAEARRYNDLLLQKEPANLQASNLRTLIDDKVAKEGLMGVAIVSGIAVAAGVIGGVLMRNMGRRR